MEMSSGVRALFESLKVEFTKFGKFDVEEKNTSYHITHKGAFAGIHPRKSYLILNIVSSSPIKSHRVAHLEQVSKSRFHNKIKIEKESDIDDELIDWLRQAYELMS
ncbi:hypothetical protein DGWBC_1168 [Dehalogenimonas sp. WBC-2]|nr:hypothetical protein DGWBC_1168 [Dehalogenimonas sp. WBC-2]